MKDIVQNSETGEDTSSYSSYNLRLIKDFIIKAKFTVVFIAVIWIMYIIECIFTWVTVSTSYGFTTIPGYVLVELGGNVSLLVRLGQVHRLFSAIFLHGGIMHILMNTASLLAFCIELESILPKKYYVTIFLIGGIQGNLFITQGTCSVICTILI
jgi:membrane associated rhomboid family serine protease